MIVDLRESTQANVEQDWLNTNLARLSGLLQGRRSLEELGRIVLGELAPEIPAQYGALFVAEPHSERASLRRLSTYGHPGDGSREWFGPGEGLVGQCAVEKRIVTVAALPADYLTIPSGPGHARTRRQLAVPVRLARMRRG